MSAPNDGRHLVMPRMADEDKIDLKDVYLVQAPHPARVHEPDQPMLLGFCAQH
jgi:hypothetical protein